MYSCKNRPRKQRREEVLKSFLVSSYTIYIEGSNVGMENAL